MDITKNSQITNQGEPSDKLDYDGQQSTTVIQGTVRGEPQEMNTVHFTKHLFTKHMNASSHANAFVSIFDPL